MTCSSNKSKWNIIEASACKTIISAHGKQRVMTPSKERPVNLQFCKSHAAKNIRCNKISSTYEHRIKTTHVSNILTTTRK